MNVLSLFYGMSCGQIALNRIGKTPTKYYAAEIDKYAIKVTQANYTNHVSNTQRYKMIGNGWTVDVIAHIFSYMEHK